MNRLQRVSHRIATSWTEESLGRLPIDELDQMAFGITQGLHQFPLALIKIRHMPDWRGALHDVNISGMEPEEWARQYPVDEPIEVWLQDGKYHIDDGHHRYRAAQILKRPTILADLTIKDNPVLAILKRQESS